MGPGVPGALGRVRAVPRRSPGLGTRLSGPPNTKVAAEPEGNVRRDGATRGGGGLGRPGSAVSPPNNNYFPGVLISSEYTMLTAIYRLSVLYDADVCV